MRALNETVISDGTNSGTVTSSAIDASSMTNAALQAYFSDGAAAGTLKLQGSNDHVNPSHWNDVPSSSSSVSSGATTMTAMVNICYQWVRVVWTSSGGAGLFTVNIKSIGF